MGTLFFVLLVVGAIMYKRYRGKKNRHESIEIELNVIDSTSFEKRDSTNLRPTSYSTNFPSFSFCFWLLF